MKIFRPNFMSPERSYLQGLSDELLQAGVEECTIWLHLAKERHQIISDVEKKMESVRAAHLKEQERRKKGGLIALK